MCTRILWNDNKLAVLAGRTLDWPESTDPVLMVFPRGMERDGARAGSQVVVKENPATWVSKYGSLVTTGYGIGSADGFNERGLGIHMLYLRATDVGPRNRAKPGVQIGLWGKMGARGPMLHHLTPDGTSVAHGLLSTTLEDFARWGMLFTPSWNKTAFDRVVSAQVLKRIQTGGNPAAFKAGTKYQGLCEDFGEPPWPIPSSLTPFSRMVLYTSTAMSVRDFTSIPSGISSACTSPPTGISRRTVKTR